jgi:hypothetical protein
MRGAAHLPKGGLPGEKAASRQCDTVFANPLTGPRAAEDIEWEQDDSVLPMRGMGSRNFPSVRSIASAPSKARLCQSGVGPDPGSLGQIPGTAWCVVEGNDNGEAYTGR